MTADTPSPGRGRTHRLQEIREAPAGPGTLAFFDFDGTLIDGYSAGALYAHRLRNLEIGPAEIVQHGASRLARPDPDRGAVRRPDRRAASRAGPGATEDGDRRAGRATVRAGRSPAACSTNVAVVKAHQRRGTRWSIATSATALQVAPLARELGIEHVLCTELESEDGVLTGGSPGVRPGARARSPPSSAFARRARGRRWRGATATPTATRTSTFLPGGPAAPGQPQPELAATPTSRAGRS